MSPRSSTPNAKGPRKGQTAESTSESNPSNTTGASHEGGASTTPGAPRSPRPQRSSRSPRTSTDTRQAAKHWAREWIDAFVFAAVVAIVLRTFLFGSYRIPTPSMENSLMTGDFLMVSKIAYGPRTPMTIGIPFTQLHIPGVQLPWFRLPGFTEVKRNDIFVFNYPIDVAPISAKTNYIKRAVGVPGDTLEIRDKMLFVNGQQEEMLPDIRHHHLVHVRERVRLSEAKVAQLDADILQTDGGSLYILNMSRQAAEAMEQWPEVDSVRYFTLPQSYNEFQRGRFTFSQGFQNHDQIPSMVVPFKGQVIELGPETWHLYKDVITRYERQDVRMRDSLFYLDGEPISSYTIRKDYYFALGDNRDDSEDSRFWGFVPDDHVVGKAWLVYFSWDKERGLPRFNRFFRNIHNAEERIRQEMEQE